VNRSSREDFENLIARSSIGAALADIKARGNDAHLVDLEREMIPLWLRDWRRKKAKRVKTKAARE